MPTLFSSPFACLVSLALLGTVLSGCGSDSSNTEREECSTTSDCSEASVCRDGTCSVVTACLTDVDCPDVCDSATNTCVECTSGQDCSQGAACVGKVCRAPCIDAAGCAEDEVCTSSGFCGQCATDAECANDEHCDSSVCAADVCPAGASVCESESSVSVCSPRGDQASILLCADGDSCDGVAGSQWCSGWICVPDESICVEGNSVQTCSSDGLSVAETTDCGAEGVCVAGTCEPRVCEPFLDFCNEDGNVHACNGLGTDSTRKDTCGSVEYCDPDAPACRPQVCTPDAAGCDGPQRATCDALGSGWTDQNACASDETCEDAQCEPVVCTPSSRFCVDGDVRLCNPLGTADSLQDDCTALEFCREVGNSATCEVDACDQGQPDCIGDSLGTCNDDGSDFVDQPTDCTASGQVCVDAACQTPTCTLGDRLCVDGDVHLCTIKGTSSQLSDACEVDEYCDTGTATCEPQICTPSALGCDGEVATVCAADGSQWEAGGTDCSALVNNVCVAGACEPVVCTPNSRFCSNQTVMLCNALGTAASASSACSASYHCYESTATYAYCRYDQCSAGAPVCSGETATVCDAVGAGPESGGTYCPDTGEVCYDGSCEPTICSGTSYFCRDGDRHRCTNNETDSYLVEDCSANEYCDGNATCQAKACEPDTDYCDAEIAYTCDSLGAGPISAGQQCWSTGQRCHQGSCEDTVCDQVGDFVCSGQELFECVDNRTRLALTDTCSAAEYCEADAGACVPQACTPSSSICFDFVTVATCDDQGKSYVPSASACPDGQACEGGACVALGDTCTISGKSWGAPTRVTDLVSGAKDVETDAEGNVFVLTNTLYPWVFRFDASTGVWSELELAAGYGDPVEAELAVSSNGDAVVLLDTHWSYNDLGLKARVFDRHMEQWSDEMTIWDPCNNSYNSIGADAQGRFAGVFSGAASSTTCPGHHALSYIPGYGWKIHAYVGVAEDYNSLDVTPSGMVGITWRESEYANEVFWTSASLPGLNWATPTSIDPGAGPDYLTPTLTWADGMGSSAWIGFFDTRAPTTAHVVSWSPGSGITSLQNLGALSYTSTFPVELTGLGEAIALVGDGYLWRYPAGGSSWVSDGQVLSRGNANHVLTFASGEAIAHAQTQPDSFAYYDPSSGWTSETIADSAKLQIAKLPGCRAVAAGKLDGIYLQVMFYE